MKIKVLNIDGKKVSDIEISDIESWDKTNEFYRKHDKGGKG